MKKRLFMIVTAIVAAALAAFALFACDSKELTEITTENARLRFTVGDEFETGADFKVIAHYSDGSTADVTADAVVTTEKSLDMNVAGDYMVTVSYGGKKTAYTIIVGDFTDLLKSIAIDSAAVKKSYMVGDGISYDGIKLTATYENAQGGTYTREYSSVKDFTVTVTTAAGETAGDVFESLGEHTVTIAKGSVSASYKVNVSGYNLATVQSAIGVAMYGRRAVNGGTAAISETISRTRTTDFTFEFGDNYTGITEKYVSDGDASVSYERGYYYGLEEDGTMMLVTKENDTLIPSNPSQKDAMNGITYDLWYFAERAFGIESALNKLYAVAKDDPNGDLVETADEANGKYKFTFGYLYPGIGNERHYYFETEAELTIGADHAVTAAKLTQKQYSEGDYVVTDGKGAVKNGAHPGYIMEIETAQTTGARTAVNPYPPEAMTISSFSLQHNGQALEDGATIEGAVTKNAQGAFTSTATFRIVNILPETASLSVDLPDLSDGAGMPEKSMYYGEGVSIYLPENSNIITVTFLNGGDWKLVVSTRKVTRTVNFKVKGLPPTELNSEVYSAAQQLFTRQSSVSTVIGSEVILSAAANRYADSSFTAAITEGNGGTLTQATVNGRSCYKFSATAAGTYKVKLTSTSAPTVSCTLTVTVLDAPDLPAMLSGAYTVTDSAGNVYAFNFTKSTESATAVSGTLTVTLTPASGAAKTQNFTFAAEAGQRDITLTSTGGDELGISLEIKTDGALAMRDMYETLYTLNR